MFKILLLTVFIALAAAGGSDESHAEIESLKSDVRPDGFDIQLKTTNNIDQSASGDVHGNIHGAFGWISPEGVHVDVKYVADENGYQPQSDLLPTPPPIPAEIVRALAWLEAHPNQENKH
ncbi:larval cuticle protein 2-like [Scaptodrosophila lebanonensis]|uniref:Larval cuticle protein 2-like n=1 Tax=Drosophila lebanonensis TaxID=7225 RepID=A0A6J2UMB8_DROLE|nr:larval cuticle protein 2-like [Scaptodrosophila lebanonensis]